MLQFRSQPADEPTKAHPRLPLTLSPPPPPTAPPPAPLAGPRQLPADRSDVRPSRTLRTAAVDRGIADRARGVTPSPSPAPAPTLRVTGHESPVEARAKFACWTLAEDLTRVCATAAFRPPGEAHQALATLQEHARRLLGNSFAGGMLCGLAEQASHLIAAGASPCGVVTMVCLGAAQFVPPLAVPLNTALALIGGAESAGAFVAACQAVQQGNRFEAGHQAAKGLMAGALTKVASAERVKAVQALHAGKVAINPIQHLAAARTGFAGLVQECRSNRLAAKQLLQAGHGHGGAHGHSPVLERAHGAETSGRLSGGGHHGPAEDDRHPGTHHGKPAAHH
jgi:hypothetical protein